MNIPRKKLSSHPRRIECTGISVTSDSALYFLTRQVGHVNTFLCFFGVHKKPEITASKQRSRQTCSLRLWPDFKFKNEYRTLYGDINHTYRLILALASICLDPSSLRPLAVRRIPTKPQETLAPRWDLFVLTDEKRYLRNRPHNLSTSLELLNFTAKISPLSPAICSSRPWTTKSFEITYPG